MKHGRIKNQIKINDTVRITDPGETYTNYSEKFNELGFKNKKVNRSLERGETAIVFNIGYHEQQREILYALAHEDGRECLISSRGIELVDYKPVEAAVIEDVLARLSKVESLLDALTTQQSEPVKSLTAVEWFVHELTAYDYGSEGDYYDICVSADKFEQLKSRALEMEKQLNCK